MRHPVGMRRVWPAAVLIGTAAWAQLAPPPPAAERVPPPAAAGKNAPGAPAAARMVNFSFDAADLRLLVKLVGEMTGRRFVLGDKVDGKITVLSPGQIPQDEVYPLFLSILESRGFSVVERDGTGYVIALPEQTSTSFAAPVTVPGGPPGSGLVTRIFKLVNVDASDFAKAIEPLVRGAKAGMLTAFGPSNHLVVTDTEDSLRRIEKILAEVDRPGSSRQVEVVALHYASAEDLAGQVMAAMQGTEKAGSSVSRHLRQVAEGNAAMPVDMLVVPSAQANSLVLVGTAVQLAELKRVIGLLDIEPVSGSGRMNAIFLKYLSAEDTAKSLNALLAKTVDKDQHARVAIEGSAANNALLVDASPRDQQWVRELVESLDLPPQQVMVEVIIAEISVDKKLDLGVEWSTVDIPGPGKIVGIARSRPGATDTAMDSVAKGVFPQGLAVGIARGTADATAPSIPLLLQALKQNNDVNILSSVPLWAQNNVEAKVNVVNNIPVLRSTIEGGSGTARDVIQNIDRMDVGIKLKFTPHVNPDRQITLQLSPSIEAVVDAGTSTTQFAPTIARREVTTTITVSNGATVVISGLIREDKIKNVSKVPLLGDIPFLGALFTYTSDHTQRNNLLIFVTPTIVTDSLQAEKLRALLENATQMRPQSVTAAGPAPAAGAVPAGTKKD